MSSTKQVPETQLMAHDDLSADDAWHALRRYGGWHLVRDAFVRFRYGDGFSHSRALALQLCLAVVPFLIALTGLATELGVEEGGQIVADTVIALTPGASEDLVGEVLPGGLPGEADEDAENGADDTPVEEAGELALVLGLITGMVSLTTAMSQIERGANRIYGVERDRPVIRKYARASLLSVVAGLPALLGFILLAAGDAVGDSIEKRYAWGDRVENVWDVVRWPVSLVLTVLAVSLLFRYAPRRRQPGLTWLMFGGVIATSLWWAASLLLAAYVRGSDGFGATYGPLTGVMALLLWANLTGIALYFGLAFSAQLEAVRVGVREPAMPDRWAPQQSDVNV